VEKNSLLNNVMSKCLSVIVVWGEKL